MAASQALLVLASDRGESILEHVFSGAMPAGTLVGGGCQAWFLTNRRHAPALEPPLPYLYSHTSGVPPKAI